MIYTIIVFIMRSFTFVLLFVAALLPFRSPAQEQTEGRKVVSKVVPEYPELASKMQIRGTVKLEALVAPNGKVKLTQVVGGSPLLGESGG
jgi:outer membrane biosynthesis protein TonB